VLEGADLRGSNFSGALMHRCAVGDARREGATFTDAEGTDRDLAWAEDYRPPRINQ